MRDMLWMLLMRRLRSLASVAFVATAAAMGCGDDSFIATNEIPDPDLDATTGNSGSAGTGGQGGASGGGGESAGGSGGVEGCTPGDPPLEVGTCENCGVSRRHCDASGQLGPPVCEAQGECEAGAEETAACGNCGSNKRTCGSSCTWGAFGACSGEGVCAPGAIDTNCSSGGKLDPCQVRQCTNSCQWGACKLKAGAVCAWEAGTNFKCCGTDMWQFCSSASCDWHPCAPCNGCSAC
jgi:hypothetical protein